MACKDIKGISNINCELVKGGITDVWMIPFDTIDQYTYTDDNLDRITGYSTTTLPVHYKPNSETSEYTGNKSLRDYKLYNHTLSLIFAKMDEDKREELIKLESLELTIIFKDVTGTCWIMGQDIPCLLNSVEVGTGNSSGDNAYTIEFVSTEKQHIREIECPSIGCFASFTAEEVNRSTFTIPLASTFNWGFLETDINTTLVDITPSVPLQPTDWNTDPAILAHDRQVLLNLFGSLGANITNLITTYNSNTDIVTIQIESDNSVYGTLQVDTTVFNRSSFFNLINLKTVLSPGIANANTIIQVSDSNGVLYSAGYGVPITGVTGVFGTADDSVILVSQLYPTGATLTVEILNVPCATNQYTYNYRNTLQACDNSRIHEFLKGRKQKLTIPYVIVGSPNETVRFQHIKLNIDGIVFTLYHHQSRWHDSEIKLEHDVRNLLSQVPLSIDTSTLDFTFTATGTEITFLTNADTNQTNPFFYATAFGYNQNATYPNWDQSRIVQLDTIAPLGSTIEHSTGTNSISGVNLTSINAPIGFELGYNPTNFNQTIDDVGLFWALDDSLTFDEDTILTTSATNGDCNSGSIVEPLPKCYNGYTSSTSSSLTTFRLNAGTGSVIANRTFDITVNGVTTSFILPFPLKPNEGSQFFCYQLNLIKGIKVVDYYYNSGLSEYVFYVEIDNGISVTSLIETTSNRPFILGSYAQIHENAFTDTVNPYIEFSWGLQNTPPAVELFPGNTTVGRYAINGVNNSSAQYSISTVGEILLEKILINPAVLNRQYLFTLHEDFPSLTNSIRTYGVFQGTSSNNITTLTVDLAASNSSLSAINYIAFTDNNGRRIIHSINLTSTSPTRTFIEANVLPRAWGTIDNIKHMEGLTTNNPVYSSTNASCNGCCEGAIVPTNSSFLMTSIATPDPLIFNVTITFTQPVDCSIFSMRFFTLNSTPFRLNNQGCTNGDWVWNGFIPFSTPQAGNTLGVTLSLGTHQSSSPYILNTQHTF